jgi:aromatic ring hydroxylase
MISPKEYRNRILSLKKNIYIDGMLVGRDDPRILPGINVIAKTYELANLPEFKDFMIARSHITGEEINRFTHIHQSSDDLLKKQKMTRMCCRVTGGCIQRCMGIDAVNALSVITYEMDKKLGTTYNGNFLNFLRYFQENDLTANCAQTDIKGDRSKRPHQQMDPDLYLRVVEKRQDGIVVRGAKAHNTLAPYADEIIVVPTRQLTEEERDWAVSFAVPADTEGVYLVVRPSSPRPRKQLIAPYAEYGDAESFTIFDNVFVPWERVFMCGEREFGGQLALLFALYHRHSYTGCKPGYADIFLGTAALVAEYNGIENAQHVRHKLAELISVAELVYSAGIAGASNAKKSSSGTFIPDQIFCNVGRKLAGESIYHEYQIVADLSGGLPATLPLEGDFYNEKIGPLLAKYMMRNPDISAENQHKLFRFVGDLICSGHSGLMQVAGVHGGGSPIMEEIGILSSYDIEEKKRVVKHLAGVDE